jgi:hypothetical protein
LSSSEVTIEAPASGRRPTGIYVVSYVAFGVPIVIEDQLTGPLGEVPAVVCYTAVTVLLALISLIAQRRINRRAWS